MSVQTLAGQPVEVHITGADGRLTDRPLSERERALAERADACLRAEPKALPAGATWPSTMFKRAELNGGLPEHDPAYLYLRYVTADGRALEFWARFGPHDALDVRRGLVTVADTTPVRLTKPDHSG